MKAFNFMTIAALAAVLLASQAVMAHDMFEKHRQHQQVKAVQWYNWITDQFALFIWCICAIVIFPVGTIVSFFGYPDLYAQMYDGVVSGTFRLAAY